MKKLESVPVFARNFFSQRGRALVLVLFVCAFAIRAVGLTSPREVVFDEVHFGKFLTAYCCTHERFFDIHPPHGKLLLAGTAWLGGYRGEFAFEQIGEAYPPSLPLFSLRFLPMFVGSLLPVLVYALLRSLGVKQFLSFLGGWLVVWDNAFVVQSRLISLDMILVASIVGSLWLTVLATRLRGYAFWSALVGSGVLAGIAVGTKFTGLVGLGLVGVYILVQLVRAVKSPERWRWFMAGCVVLAATAVTYLFGWGLHYGLLSEPGPGDAFHVPQFEGFVVSDFARELSVQHSLMLSTNYNLGAEHPYASSAWGWPLMRSPVFYWSGPSRFIYFLGNPLVWWGSSIIFAAACVHIAIQFGRRGRRVPPLFWVPLLGFVVAFVPLARVPRVLFLYHYLTPLLFALVAGGVWLEQFLSKSSVVRRRHWSAVAACLLPILLFVVLSPLTYGLALPTWYVNLVASLLW